MLLVQRIFLYLGLLILIPCSDSVASDTPTQLSTESTQSQSVDIKELEAEIGFKVYDERWTGDLDEMETQRMIRVLTVYGLGRYYLDSGRPKGLTYELFSAFENFVNKRMGKRHLRVHVVFIPVSRDQLFTSLIEGRGDIVAAGLTITPEREAIVDFTRPLTKELSEVLVTGPSAPDIKSIDDLSGKSIYVRASSSYRSSLDQLNERFRNEGKPEVVIEDASEHL